MDPACMLCRRCSLHGDMAGARGLLLYIPSSKFKEATAM